MQENIILSKIVLDRSAVVCYIICGVRDKLTGGVKMWRIWMILFYVVALLGVMVWILSQGVKYA